MCVCVFVCVYVCDPDPCLVIVWCVQHVLSVSVCFVSGNVSFTLCVCVITVPTIYSL